MTGLASVETDRYAVPNEESLDDATQSFDVLELVVVEVETEAGDRGTGFTYTIGEGGAAIAEYVDSTLGPLFEDCPAAPRPARDHLRAGTTFVGREGISELANSAVDIALWDALGRRLASPLYELIGADRGPVPAYQTHGGWLQYGVDRLVENAHDAADRGFAGMKMKVGLDHAEDARRVAAVREALPDAMDLMIDANCSLSVPEARRLAGRLSDVAVDWLEEPLPKDDYVAHADLREHVDIPIALGENLFSPRQFAQAIALDAVDVVQPDVCRCGGVTGWLDVAAMAAARNLPVSPHYIEPIHAHLARGFEVVPYIEHHSTVLDGVMADPVLVEDGVLVPPSTPGHGVRFEGLEEYQIDR